MVKKGAIQMSLGFIVAVVFAIVLLSLAITWLNSFMGNINTITDDLTQEAQTELKSTFSETDSKFSVHPQEYNLERGHELKLLAGIINKEEDSFPHNYQIFVKSQNGVDSWIDDSGYAGETFSVPFGKIQYIPITIKPTSSAEAKTYTFWIYACQDVSGACTESNYNYETRQYVRIALR